MGLRSQFCVTARSLEPTFSTSKLSPAQAVVFAQLYDSLKRGQHDGAARIHFNGGMKNLEVLA